MESVAIAKYIRRSPEKIRGIANNVRSMNVSDAVTYLEHLPNKGADNIRKVLLSASANAVVKNPDISTDNLFVKTITVDKGPFLKRVKPRARGRADRIHKRTAHLKVVLVDKLGDK
ncbi:MAG: 50S ribosomal protein L22 [Spirochaetes bacterium]|nr:50S ribosomal protein L22 [Spirochaetota bacterium]MCK5266944.1 50S ribosomal protein L22 [Spirochaetota bacterium]